MRSKLIAAPRASAHNRAPAALAAAAHPDDIEFYMAGTLLLLRQAGFAIHYLTLANGSCGSLRQTAAQIRAVRRRESQRAAAILGATFHPSFVNDLEILYALPLLRRLAAVIRQIQPSVILTHSPEDYMEDHVTACRLTVTAAFVRGMPNFRVTPTTKAAFGDVTLYHAMPHGLRDGLGKPIRPDFIIDTGAAHSVKCQALEAHASQREWLDASQGIGSYVSAMSGYSRQLGQMSGQFEHGEGWRKHSHLGFCSESADPLRAALGHLAAAPRDA